MSRVCTVCSHPSRKEIDKAILSGMANRRIAAQWSLSENAVRRHKADHLPRKVAKAAAAREVVQAGSLLDQVRGLLDKAHSLTDRAEKAGDLRTALSGVREIRGTLELMAKVMGDLPSGPTVGILVSPEWVTIRTAILQALEVHPDARQVVIEALDRIPSPPPGPPPVPAPLTIPATFTPAPYRRGEIPVEVPEPVILANLMRGGDRP